jgi:antitoxin ParD1/3/4
MATTITLTPELEAALAAQVAGGNFESIEEAARELLEEMLFAREMEKEDFSWIKPLLKEAEEQLKRGEGIPLEEHRRLRAAHMEKLAAGV